MRLIQGDCLIEIKQIPEGSVDMVLADPPYPDYHTDKWGFVDLGFLKLLDCKQLIFWSAKVDFPLDYTAIHIWDKKTGVGSMYERIFERNGGKAYRVFRHYLINSTVAAKYTKDVFTGHPSQKPINLILELIEKYTEKGDTILDPFMGSGTTGVACAKLNREFIGIELDETYFEIAQKRIKDASAQIIMGL